jgi:hypothetical protein
MTTSTQKARQISEATGGTLKYIAVCPEHGAAGPFDTEAEAQLNVDLLNADSAKVGGCVYKLLPIFMTPKKN